MKTRLYEAIEASNTDLALKIISGKDRKSNLEILLHISAMLLGGLIGLVVLLVFGVMTPFYVAFTLYNDGVRELARQINNGAKVLLEFFTYQSLRKILYLFYFELQYGYSTPLILAIDNDLKPVVDGLIELGVDVNQAVVRDYSSDIIPLKTAIDKQQFDVAIKLVVAGAQADKLCYRGGYNRQLTPIYEAVSLQNYSLEFIRFMIRQGVIKDIHSQANEIFHFKLEDSDYEVHIQHHSLLLHAIFAHQERGGAPELIQHLIDNGVDINHPAQARSWVHFERNGWGLYGDYKKITDRFANKRINDERSGYHYDVLTPLKAALCLNLDQVAVTLLQNRAIIKDFRHQAGNNYFSIEETRLSHSMKVKALRLAMEHGITLTDEQIGDVERQIIEQTILNVRLEQVPFAIPIHQDLIGTHGLPTQTIAPPTQTVAQPRTNIFSRAATWMFRSRRPGQAQVENSEEEINLIDMLREAMPRIPVPSAPPLITIQSVARSQMTAIEEAFEKLQLEDPTFTRDDERILANFKCPFTLELFKDPCSVFQTGSTVDKEQMENWFRISVGQPKDPITTYIVLDASRRYYGENISLRRAILEHLENLRKEAVAKKALATVAANNVNPTPSLG